MRPKHFLAAFTLVCVAAFVAPRSAATAEEARGVFGATLSVTGGGVLTVTIRSATIARVVPGLPAASAGVAAGDEVLEIDGRPVPGAAAKDLAPLAQGKRVGESVTLRLKRPDGTSYTVRLVAVAPPG